MTSEGEKEQRAREGLCCHWFKALSVLSETPVCNESVEEGQTLCVAHRSERTKEELELFGDIVRDRMKRTDKKQYDFRGFRFPEGFRDFRNVTFEGDADFRSSHFEGGANFWSAIFKGDADFMGAQIKGDADFENVGFGRSVDFRVESFGGKVNCYGATLPPSGRFGSAKEWWNKSKIKTGRGKSFCRFVKQVLQNMGLYQEAGDFHYEERRHALYRRVFLPGETVFLPGRTGTRRLLNLVNPFVMIPALIEFIFGRIIFGYGERPNRIVAAAAVIVGCCAWIYDYSEAIVNEPGEALRGLEHAVYFSIVTFTTLGFGDYAPVPGHPIYRVAALEAVAGAFLMAAFIVTLARRWGRG